MLEQPIDQDLAKSGAVCDVHQLFGKSREVRMNVAQTIDLTFDKSSAALSCAATGLQKYCANVSVSALQSSEARKRAMQCFRK